MDARDGTSSMILRADARFLPLLDGCVDCCVTSPPYFGLRDYGHGDQIGLEGTPEAYVASLVQVFREVRRVLKDSGTVWANFGDSYNSGGGFSPNAPSNQPAARRLRGMDDCITGKLGTRMPRIDGLKHKDLLGIPWRVAFALQADGWYLRSDIIWSKPNPMPESVTDRPTKAHEYLFLLAKSERYHYDAAAIYEPYAESTLMEIADGYRGEATKDYFGAGVQDPSDTKRRVIEGIRKRVTAGASRRESQGELTRTTPVGRSCGISLAGRNRRTVWTVNTQPYSGAHFATMPEALVEPCILAGCPLGGLVLDPFLGSGTVGAVAERLGRRWVGTDLSYQPLAQKRTAQRGIRFEPEEVA
jgi:DNA modification methylase